MGNPVLPARSHGNLSTAIQGCDIVDAGERIGRQGTGVLKLS